MKVVRGVVRACTDEMTSSGGHCKDVSFSLVSAIVAAGPAEGSFLCVHPEVVVQWWLCMERGMIPDAAAIR